MSKPERVGVLYSRVRVEEKLLFEAFEKRGVALDLLDDQKLIFDITDVKQPSLPALRRHRRALHQSQPRALQPEDPERPGRQDGEHRARAPTSAATS